MAWKEATPAPEPINGASGASGLSAEEKEERQRAQAWPEHESVLAWICLVCERCFAVHRDVSCRVSQEEAFKLRLEPYERAIAAMEQKQRQEHDTWAVTSHKRQRYA